MSNSAEIRRRFVGKVLGGRYRLDALIDHGGMGAVFRATRLRYERQVAIKLLWEDELPDDRHDRFLREGLLPTDIHHPNVVVVHDVDSHVDADSGRELIFIVMELLDGEDLAAWLRKRMKIDVPQALEILAQAARGVAATHRRGIVHRDLKPRNLMIVSSDPDDLLVKVVDFGIAKPFATVDEFGDLTVAPAFMGSARYASPEQLHGRPEPGPPSDVFSLGVVAYELLTGSLPFSEDDRARLSQHLPVPLVHPARLNPAVPPEVDAVVVRCLQIDPAARYRNAHELVAELDVARRAVAPRTTAAVDGGTLEALDQTEIDVTVPHGDSRFDSQGRSGDAVAAVDVASAAISADAGNPADLAGGNGDADPPAKDRRRNRTQSRLPRMRMGPWTRAAAVVMGIAVFVAALGATDTGAGLFHEIRNYFTEPPEIEWGKPLTGALDEGDDTTATGKRYEEFRYHGEEGETVNFAMESAAFEGQLEWGRYVNGRWTVLESSGGLRPAQLHVTVADDTIEYRLRVRAARQGARGWFVVNPTRGRPALSPGRMLRSRLTAADAFVANDVWGEEWTVRVPAGSQVTVTVHPEGFGARMWLLRQEAGRPDTLEEATSRSAGQDAQLTATVSEGGEYRIRVQNRVKKKVGFYTLRLGVGAGELRPGAPVTSRISRADTVAAAGVLAEQWVYRGNLGEPVAIRLRPQRTAVLELWRLAGGEWKQLRGVRSAGGLAEIVVRPAAPGEYYLRVRASTPGDTGTYALESKQETVAGAIQAGQTVSGQLNPGDPHGDGRYHELWSFSGSPGQTVLLELRTYANYPVLSFGCWTADGIWQEIGRNVSYDGSNAYLDAQVGGTGDCIIRTESLSSGMGAYSLSVRPVQLLVPKL